VTGLKTKLLIVEDDTSFSDEICAFLSRFEFEVSAVGSLAEMRSQLKIRTFTIIILDQFLDGEDALSSIMALGMNFAGPIVVLTANTDPTDIVLGLELGARDFINKTQPPREILARIRAVLRQSSASLASAMPTRWKIDRATRTVTSPTGRDVALTTLEYQVLTYLAEKPGVTVSRTLIMKDIFNKDYVGTEDRTVDFYISRIRSKLSQNDNNKENVIRPARGIGYILLDIFDIA
jgi:two-component system OmpR family response regulator